MLYLITGGSGSGKSEYAEELVQRKQRECEAVCGSRPALVYLAAMYPYDLESRKRIAKHREMRKEKKFVTVERYYDVGALDFKEFVLQDGTKPVLLLECLSNLTANEMYLEGGAGNANVEEIIRGILTCAGQVLHMVIVTNEVFGDGRLYEEETEKYRRFLASVNIRLSAMADEVTEIVYGIPVDMGGKS